VVVFTTGILAAPRRETTAEGIERDIAISYLSRLAILRELAPRLRRSPRARVFVMGFPGTGQAGRVDDLNGETKYDAMDQHMTTVAGNEALVVDFARRHVDLGIYGLNPGLVKTDIRANFLGAGSLKHRLVETMIGLFTPSPERYAERTVPLLFAPELDGRTGAMFGAKGDPILPSPEMTPQHAAKLLAASETLLARALPG
jgi:NAD(P)-dependent dehydrogenase (short-subunit alcohol dehydrogenase family)